MGNNYKKEYEKFEDVPEDKKERLQYIYKKLNIKEKDIETINDIISKIKIHNKNNRIEKKMVFYIKPEGISRPRTRFGGKGFYVPNIQKFYKCMNDYMDVHKELYGLNIISDIRIDLQYYLPIPSDMKRLEKLLAELKIIRSIKKPDWDNLGKSSDMLNKIWLDDSLIVDARVRKFYSFKPRIEVTIWYYESTPIEYYNKVFKKVLERRSK